MEKDPTKRNERELERLSALHDGELPPSAAEALRDRMQADEDLLREYKALGEVDSLLEKWAAPELDEHRGHAIADRVMERVRRDLTPQRPSPVSWLAFMRQPAMATAAWVFGGVLTGLVLLGIVGRGDAPGPLHADAGMREMLVTTLVPEQAETIGRIAGIVEDSPWEPRP